MIITSDDNSLQVGKSYQDQSVSDMDGVWHKVAFMVIKKVSEEEYIKYCEEYARGRIKPLGNYYQISMD